MKAQVQSTFSHVSTSSVFVFKWQLSYFLQFASDNLRDLVFFINITKNIVFSTPRKATALVNTHISINDKVEVPIIFARSICEHRKVIAPRNKVQN